MSLIGRQSRLDSLDWHRGLLALSIMICHLTDWNLYHPASDEVLGRLEIYSVSMFFILSGLSMGVVYSNFIRDSRSTISFYIRRIFRIWPLLWIAVSVVVAGEAMLKNKAVDWIMVVLNLTTLFGFISPTSYINTGAWSIGNEMVYYAMTPVIVLLYNKNIAYGNIVFAGTVVVGSYFAFSALSAVGTLAEQWKVYINPFNNLFFYTAGIAIYYNARSFEVKQKVVIAVLFVAVLIFCFYPANGDLIQIVTGTNRLVFFLVSVLMVFGFYKLTFEPPRLLGRSLAALGVATYGVYLLHPIVYQAVKITLKWISDGSHVLLLMVLTAGLTVIGALVSFRIVEAPMIRLGKALTPRVTTSAAGRREE
jgi:exopolysaccharide production protein ExoZ